MLAHILNKINVFIRIFRSVSILLLFVLVKIGKSRYWCQIDVGSVTIYFGIILRNISSHIFFWFKILRIKHSTLGSIWLYNVLTRLEVISRILRLINTVSSLRKIVTRLILLIPESIVLLCKFRTQTLVGLHHLADVCRFFAIVVIIVLRYGTSSLRNLRQLCEIVFV